MDRLKNFTLLIIIVSVMVLNYSVYGTANSVNINSPDEKIRLNIFVYCNGQIGYKVNYQDIPVIEKSFLGLVVENVSLGDGVDLVNTESYVINESYPWRGIHSTAVNHCNGASITVNHRETAKQYNIDARVFNDGIAFCYNVPGKGDRVVSGETTSFVVPEGSTVWYHDFYMHYEGAHDRKNIADAKAGEWAAPPLTVKLPNNIGYASISESAIINFSGMGLQADGHRGFNVRLGHEVPASYPYVLRYGEENAKRLAVPATINGPIKTPWRVILIGPDLNTLFNSDIIHNLSPTADKKLFPEGFDAEWLKPGRAVWGYLTDEPRTLEGMKELSRLAGELGFEYHIVEGHWQRWSVEDRKDLIEYSRENNVKILLWKHSRDLRDPDKFHEFFKHIHELGAAGSKIDFFDHEAKEIIDLYKACLREAAKYKLIIDFHGANKPAGESRTWPNEMTREGIRGFEMRGPWARHNTTLPFTRMLAGHADYTVLHFGDRRCETSETHQIASSLILQSPMLVFAEHPKNLLNHKAVDLIKQIPSVWDETIVLPMSEIGEIAAFARRIGDKWFLAVMNGPQARFAKIDLSFLGDGDYKAMLLRDEKGNSTSVSLVRKRQTFGPKPGVIIDNTTVKNNESLFIELVAGGGFVAVFSQ